MLIFEVVGKEKNDAETWRIKFEAKPGPTHRIGSAFLFVPTAQADKYQFGDVYNLFPELPILDNPPICGEHVSKVMEINR